MYLCQLCGEEFAAYWVLRLHLANHQAAEQVRSWQRVAEDYSGQEMLTAIEKEGLIRLMANNPEWQEHYGRA